MLDSLFDPQVVFIDDTGQRQKRPWRRASAGVLMCRSSNNTKCAEWISKQSMDG